MNQQASSRRRTTSRKFWVDQETRLRLWVEASLHPGYVKPSSLSTRRKSSAAQKLKSRGRKLLRSSAQDGINTICVGAVDGKHIANKKPT
ncbi:hypothetical protein PoB_003176000 [Plakobranchus ocellatus]|uniref:Uncharacterized protein n=1 Tax=Plakobranchus ocellatus TaxID=259542 RepID=A0AAV4AD41_9GAST|nr:hypothetical protein PoB_003176000 [Plakobranchus ocellatus]